LCAASINNIGSLTINRPIKPTSTRSVELLHREVVADGHSRPDQIIHDSHATHGDAAVSTHEVTIAHHHIIMTNLAVCESLPGGALSMNALLRFSSGAESWYGCRDTAQYLR
jgi:hypothetical protein